MRIVLFAFLFLSFAFAHKLNVFIFQENKDVIVSSYFASGSFCKSCKVEVFDSKNKLLEKGKTNKKGEYIIKNLDSNIEVKVEAIGGHAALMKFEVKNLESKKKIEKPNSIFQSLIAALLIALIFLGLKKYKNDKV